MRPFHDLSAEEYAALDIAEVNLQCAVDLPGSDQLDVHRELRIVDRWAEMVGEETERRWNQFVRTPEKFENSEAYFRMLVLATVLQLKCGVQYNLATLEGEIDYTDSRQHFIHGILEGFGGTCATLPVLYAAVGRRLGYPLKLATAVGHLFCRWDDPQRGIRFNVEASGRGLVVYSDDYYRAWPESMSRLAEQVYGYLVSLSPRQELAEFYDHRARCYFDWGCFRQAMELHGAAVNLWPENAGWRQHYAMDAVLHLETSGQVLYGLLSELPLPKNVVLDHGRMRRMEPWETQGACRARQELARLAENRQFRERRRREGAPETIFPDYSGCENNTGQHSVRKDRQLCTLPN